MREFRGKSGGKASWVSALVLLSLCIAMRGEALDEYRAKETPGKLQLTTPFGEKTYVGSNFRLNSMHNYKVVIPLSVLEPPGSKEDDEDDDNEAAEAATEKKVEEVKNETTITNLPAPVATPTPEPEKEARKPAAKDGLDYDDTNRLVVEANHFYNLGRYYEAMVYVEELLRKRPKYTRGWVMKGSLLYMQGHKDFAKESWEQAQKLEPESTYIKDLMARYK